MPLPPDQARTVLVENLNAEQASAVGATANKLLVIAGAGSGKTEVMARRVAWWVAVDGCPTNEIVAFTFTEAAAEELKFRIRSWLQKVALPDEEVSIGGMYIGTIHGFCLQALRELAPTHYYMMDVLDEAGRASLVEQGGMSVLAMQAFQAAAVSAGASRGRYDAIDLFLRGYDLLNEYGVLDVTLSSPAPPSDVRLEKDWCKDAKLNTLVGNSALNQAFAESAARYYAYLRARRFFDFSTVQSELLSRLSTDGGFAEKFHARWKRLVVDEVQDINPVQDKIIRAIVGQDGRLTAVGDHRQAIYAFRGGRIDLMGEIFQELQSDPAGSVMELPANYRSTPRIISLANQWSTTINDRAGMSNPNMSHGRATRVDKDSKHVSLMRFSDRPDEANWIASTIAQLVRPASDDGAEHDDGSKLRGLKYSDVAILVRSATDIRAYQDALRAVAIPAVVRAGPDLFSQPECLLAIAAFARASGVDAFFGLAQNPRSLPGRIQTVLNCGPATETVIARAIDVLRARGLHLPESTADRVIRLVRAINERCGDDGKVTTKLDNIGCTEAKAWLKGKAPLRRIFPQTILHWILYETGLPNWGVTPEAQIARFHIGQISKLIKSIETSGWTTPSALKWQAIALLQWGASSARAEEAPLLAELDAVTITTIHSAKGLEFPAVFVADVNQRRFPSQFSRTAPSVPFDPAVLSQIDPARLADNQNWDGERRLMYVALTRAERFLFVSYSGNRVSPFVPQLAPMIVAAGGHVPAAADDIGASLSYQPGAFHRETRFSTSFSDIRYFMECPQDFYLRVVLGFTPTIGQEFGYGRGVHNLLREVHSDPSAWAAIAGDPAKMSDAIDKLQEDGLFYLRYTTGDPLDNLMSKAKSGVVGYVERYRDELSKLEFEPEKAFETLIPEENLLIAGAIDVVRLDDPPRVTIIDFKSGDASGENASGLNTELMGFQIGVYGLAAKRELEYEPQQGLVRYIGERDPAKGEMSVNLSDAQLAQVRTDVVQVAKDIRERKFNAGPSKLRPDRCASCDFLNLCPRAEAKGTRSTSGMPY